MSLNISSSSPERYVNLPQGIERMPRILKGQILPLIRSGGPFIYLLYSGKALVERSNQRGGWDNLGYRKPYSIFGELFRPTATRSFLKKITALDDISVLQIEREYIQSITREDPAIGQQLRAAVSADTRALEDRAALFNHTLKDRVPVVLLDLSDGVIDRNIPYTQADLAKAAGGTREVINQILMRYRRMGILHDGARLIINGESGLKRLKKLADD